MGNENARDFFDEWFFYGKRIAVRGDDIEDHSGRICRVNLYRVEAFDLMPNGTVYAWMDSGDGYEVLSLWLIEKMKSELIFRQATGGSV